MDVSIIIPVYRVECYIKNCISSVVSQTFSGTMECIVVDDKGGDDSWNIVKQFVDNYDGNIEFVLISHNENKGVSAARNTGIRYARGEYIFFLDSDDTITPDCIDKLYSPLRDKSYDFVFANNRYICDYDISIPFLLPEGELVGNCEIIRTFRSGWYAVVWNKLINKNFIIRNNLFFEEGLIREDELFCFQMACVAESMYVIKDVTYNYVYDNPQSIMSDRESERHFWAFTDVLKKEIETIRQRALTQNPHLYYLIEEAKRWRMKDAIRLLSLDNAYLYYKNLRSLRYCNPLLLPFEKKLCVRNYIRDIHYLLPAKFGFYYIRLLNSFANK